MQPLSTSKQSGSLCTRFRAAEDDEREWGDQTRQQGAASEPPIESKHDLAHDVTLRVHFHEHHPHLNVPKRGEVSLQSAAS